MSIEVQLSVEPHFRNVRYIPGTFDRVEGSPPPAVIFSKDFERWQEVYDFITGLGIKFFGGDNTLKYLTIENKKNEYIGVELEVQDFETGTLFLAACLALEGNETQPQEGQ